MAMQIDNAVFAAAAYSYKDSHIPYSKLDCQAFVERVLHDCGVDYNWRGSNHMWRDALSWKGTISECMQKFGEVPSGAWLFTVKHDGGEIKRNAQYRWRRSAWGMAGSAALDACWIVQIYRLSERSGC